MMNTKELKQYAVISQDSQQRKDSLLECSEQLLMKTPPRRQPLENGRERKDVNLG
jgi:hypothetical protein